MTRRLPGSPERARWAAHGNARLRLVDVIEIRRRERAGESLRAIHADYPRVTWTAIQKAARGTTWQDIDGAPPAPSAQQRWTPAELAYLAAHAAQPVAEVAAALGRSPSSVQVQRSRRKAV